MDSKTIKVKINGKEYPLKGEDEELTKQAAQYVDSLMNQIQEKSADKSTAALAVLTALNLAEELLKEKRLYESTVDEAVQQINLLSERYKSISNSA
jgi:cell division protein ZapA